MMAAAIAHMQLSMAYLLTARCPASVIILVYTESRDLLLLSNTACDCKDVCLLALLLLVLRVRIHNPVIPPRTCSLQPMRPKACSIIHTPQ